MKKILTICFLFSVTLSFGQITFVDFGPDGLSVPMNENLSFDVNDDGITDFYVNKYTDELGVSPIFNVGCFASPSNGAYTSWGARELTVFEEGETIGITGANMLDYIDDDPERGSAYTIDNSLYADGWEAGVPRYIGFAVFANNGVLNGWLEAMVDETNNALIITGYAYTEAFGIGDDGFIDAGDTGITAVSDLEGSENIIVYPNPSADFVNLTFDKDRSGQVEVSIITMNGSVVSQSVIDGTTRSQNMRFDVSDLSVGSYLVKVSSESGTQVKNFMIKR